MRLNCVPNTGETTIITIPSTERLSDFLQVTELVDCGAWIQTWAVRLHRWFVLLPSGGKGWGGGKKPAAAAAATKSLQSCPTLCDPIDGISPGSPVPGILQARTLEWVAISFSNT